MADQKQKGKLFIGGLNWDTTDDAFKAYFAQFGEMVDAIIMRDQNRKSRGFGFVTYKDSSSVDKVLSTPDLELDGRKVDPKVAIPKEQTSLLSAGSADGQRTTKIFVGGLSSDTTKQEFSDYFTKFGKIVDAIIMTDRDSGKSRGFGFVTFETEDAVDKVMGTSSHMITRKGVECKRAIPKSDAPPPRAGRGALNPYGSGAYGASYASYGAYGYEDKSGYDAYGRRAYPTGGYRGGYGEYSYGYGGPAGGTGAAPGDGYQPPAYAPPAYDQGYGYGYGSDGAYSYSGYPQTYPASSSTSASPTYPQATPARPYSAPTPSWGQTGSTPPSGGSSTYGYNRAPTSTTSTRTDRSYHPYGRR